MLTLWHHHWHSNLPKRDTKFSTNHRGWSLQWSNKGQGTQLFHLNGCWYRWAALFLCGYWCHLIIPKVSSLTKISILFAVLLWFIYTHVGFHKWGYPNSWMVYNGKSYENGWWLKETHISSILWWFLSLVRRQHSLVVRQRLENLGKDEGLGLWDEAVPVMLSKNHQRWWLNPRQNRDIMGIHNLLYDHQYLKHLELS